MLTKEDLTNIKELMNEQISGVKGEISGIKGQISGMQEEMANVKEEISSMKGDITGIRETMVTKKEFNCLESRIDGLEHEVYKLRDYSHRKFVLIENEVVPKITALYEMSDSYVKQAECLKSREKANAKLDCLDPLKVVVKSHSEQLAKHNEILDKLTTNAR